MAKKKHLEDMNDTLDLKKVLVKDEKEIRHEKVLTNRKKRKLRKKRLRRVIIVGIVLLIVGYMLSSLSDIKILKVSNNVIYSQSEILDKAGLHYKGKLILHPGFLIEHKLKEDDLISDVKVSKDYLSGSIYVHVNEEKIIGHYDENGKSYVLLGNGKSVIMKDEQLALVSSPFIKDLNKQQRENLSGRLNALPDEDIALISEIRYYKTSWDDDMLELLMNDGHIVRTSYRGLELLKEYRAVLGGGLNSASRCLHFDETTNSIIAKGCE